MRAPATRAGRAPARINSTVDAEQPRVTRAWLESEPRWRIVDLPPFFRNHRASELRIRSGFRKLSVLLVVAEAKVSVFVHRPTSWFTWDRAYEIFSGSPENLGPVTDLQQIDSSSLLSGIIEVLSKHHWNDHDARDARRIRDKIIDLAREREQRLLALPPAVAIPWTDPVREGQWRMTRRFADATTATGSIKVGLTYEWAPRLGGSPSAHWAIVSARVGDAQRRSGGREPLDGVCCDQAVGDLEDWGWPRAEALSIGRAIAEKALSDWRALEPQRTQAWSDT